MLLVDVGGLLIMASKVVNGCQAEHVLRLITELIVNIHELFFIVQAMSAMEQDASL